MDPANLPEPPCPACGGRAYSWGHAQATGLAFIPDNVGFWQKMSLLGHKLRARRCDGCGNVQLFAPLPKKPAPRPEAPTDLAAALGYPVS